MLSQGTGLAWIRARSLSSIGVPRNHLLGSLRRSARPMTHLGAAWRPFWVFCIAMACKTLLMVCCCLWGGSSVSGRCGRVMTRGRRESLWCCQRRLDLEKSEVERARWRGGNGGEVEVKVEVKVNLSSSLQDVSHGNSRQQLAPENDLQPKGLRRTREEARLVSDSQKLREGTSTGVNAVTGRVESKLVNVCLKCSVTFHISSLCWKSSDQLKRSCASLFGNRNDAKLGKTQESLAGYGQERLGLKPFKLDTCS